MSKIGNKRWYIVIMLVLCYTFVYLGRASISIAGPVLMKEYGWSGTDFGLVSTAFFIGYALTMLPAGWLADKFGATKVIVGGTLLWSVFTFLTPMGAATISMLMFVRIVVGIGQGVTLPAASSLISRWVPKSEAATAQGGTLVGVPLGVALAMLSGVYLIQNYNWQTIFYIFSIFGPLWCIIWSKFGKNSPDLDPGISKEELEYIHAGQGHVSSVGSQAVSLTAKQIFSVPSVWLAIFSYFCFNYVFYLLLTWLPTYLAVGRGFTLVKSGMFTVIPYVVAMFTYPLGGILADWASKKFGDNVGRKLFPVMGLVIGGIALIFGAQTGSATAAVALISASMGFLTLTQGGFFSIPIIFAPKNVGTIVGMYGFIGTMAGIMAPLLTGFVVDAMGYNTALFLGSGLAILGAVLMFAARIRPIEAK